MLGPIIADIEGLTLSDADREFLLNPLLGGVILFTRNYTNPLQLRELIQAIKNLPRSQPLLISVDHEGGRVQRFRKHFSAIPTMASLGQLYDANPETAFEHAYYYGWLMAAELLVHGIDFSYAPVLDLDLGMSEVIGCRAFHRQPQIVIELTKAFINGMHKAGMIATGKHFPGHGGVKADSHVAVPIDYREWDELWQADLVPYQRLAQTAHLDAIMTAHVIYENIDTDPPCFSSFWLQRVLREQLQFDGIIFSDDLTMAGAATVGNYATRAELALQAGCDMLLICNNRQAVEEVIAHLTTISYTLNPVSAQRISKLYGQWNVASHDLSQHPDWQAAQSLLKQTADI